MARKPTPRDSLSAESFGDLAKIAEGESDQAAALVAAAILENYLMSLLHSFLIKSSATDELFKGDGGLESYFKCARMSYCLGLISRSAFKNMELIGKVRNEFAHSVRLKSFDDPDIASLCNQLTMPSMKPLFAHPKLIAEFADKPELQAGFEPFRTGTDAKLAESFATLRGRMRYLITCSLIAINLLSATRAVTQRQAVEE